MDVFYDSESNYTVWLNDSPVIKKNVKTKK